MAENKKIRIGNDIRIEWTLLDGDSQPYILTGRDISIEVVIGMKKARIKEFSVNENVVSFTYFGKDQKYTGNCDLKFIENDGEREMVTFDIQSAFALVSHSWEAVDAGETPETIQLEFVTVTSELVERVGPKGDTGDPAGFGEVTAEVDGNVGTPSVSVETSGPDTAKNFHFTFRNLKGNKGDKGDTPVLTADDDGTIYADGEVLTEVIKEAKETADDDHTRAESDSENAHLDSERASDDHDTAVNDHERYIDDHNTAASDHTTATTDHTRAGQDHTQAASDHTQAVSDHDTATSDHTTATADHTRAGQDHTQALSDHDTADSDHFLAVEDHNTASADHTQAVSDHDTATSDHTTASSDHTTAASDHTQAATDHSTAGTDHTRAESDHSTASSDHSQSESDHTRAESDHAIVQGYDTRLTNVEGEVSQLGQEVDELDLQVNGGLESIPYNNPDTGYFIDLSVGVGNEVSLTPLYFASIPWKYAVKEVTTDVSVIVNGEGGASGRLWGFLDADNKLLSVADASVSATSLELTVPSDAVKIVINDKSGQVSYISHTSKQEQIDEANSRITRNGKAIEETEISLFGRNSVNLNVENTGYVIRTGDYGSTAWTTPLAQNNFGYAKLNCSEGDLFFISAYGETYARAYAFCKSDNSVIESSPASVGVSKLIIAPKNTSYIVVNNDFVQNPTPVAIKVADASLSQLFKEDSRINDHINNNIEVPVFGPNATEIPIAITNYYLKTYGVGSTADTTPTTGTNYGYVKQNCVAGDVFLVYSKGGNTGLAYAFCNAENIVLKSSSPQEIVSGLVLAPEGTSYIVVNNYFVTIAKPFLYKLTDGALCSLKREIGGAVTRETEKIKTTNIGGFYLKNNKIVLSGASISESRNGYFEYAMQELEISCLNTSVASTNIYKLANLLYSSPNDFTDFDILIISHVHNYDVFTLPSGKSSFTATDYENDATIGPYIKTSSYYTGNLQSTASYTADELYAMGFDYVLKKWAALCYALRNTTGYDSVFGKPFQVIIYTYWHDARTIYNGSVRRLAKKWGISLIKDDENIGFSKKQVNPATSGQWSVLYGDTTGYVPTEVIEGVTYGLHPCRMTSADFTAWQQSGVLDKDYLPFIQKVRANILIHTLKDAIMK